MTDRYIDNGETQIYGPFARQRLETITDLDPVVRTLIERQAAVDDRMRVALQAATSTDGDIALAVDSKGPVGVEVVRAMNVFHDQVRVWNDAGRTNIPLGELYEGAKKSGAGSTPAKRRVALARLLDGIAKYPMPEKEDWQKRLGELQARLTAVVTATDAARGARKPATETLAAARDAWLRHYRAAKLVVEGLLVLAGREAELRSFFKDLQVSAPAVPEEDEPPVVDE